MAQKAGKWAFFEMPLFSNIPVRLEPQLAPRQFERAEMPKTRAMGHETAVVDVEDAATGRIFKFFMKNLDRQLLHRRVAVDDDAVAEPFRADLAVPIADPAHRDLIRKWVFGLKIEPRVHQNK